MEDDLNEIQPKLRTIPKAKTMFKTIDATLSVALFSLELVGVFMCKIFCIMLVSVLELVLVLVFGLVLVLRTPIEDMNQLELRVDLGLRRRTWSGTRYWA